MRYTIGFLLLAVGFAMVIKTEWLIQNFGTNDWAETHLGTEGGSRLMYKLMGLAGIFIAFLLIFNMEDGLMQATVGRLIIK
ncbi:MAG: hypothetical protein WC725_02260 [Patescibacteria group bacterium]|jgi:hypothetical protein